MRQHPHTLTAPLTTLMIGGPADVLELEDARDFPEVVEEARVRRTRPACLGGGSNVLIADAGTTDPVLLIRTHGIRIDYGNDTRTLVTVEAGHSLGDLVDFTVEHGLIGLETLAGIPGTVGAMPIQNVGAYGQETADTVVAVTAWDWQKRSMVDLTHAECGFGHRTSLFKRSHRWTILRVAFALTPDRLSAPVVYRELLDPLGIPIGTRLPVSDVVSAVLDVRRRKGMVLDPNDIDTRSVGSIFLSPSVDPAQAAHLRSMGASPHTYPDGQTRVGASWLLRQAGYALGQSIESGIRMSTKHYTLVADDGATATSFSAAARRLRDHVADVTGIVLTFEPDLIGVDPNFRSLTESTLHADV